MKKAKILAVGEACKAVLYPTSGFKREEEEKMVTMTMREKTKKYSRHLIARVTLGRKEQKYLILNSQSNHAGYIREKHKSYPHTHTHTHTHTHVQKKKPADRRVTA